MSKHQQDESIMAEWNRQSAKDLQAIDLYGVIFDQASGSSFSKLESFSRFVRRQRLSKFLAHAEIFRKILDVPGSILDLGVNSGQSLFTWAQLSAIFEPVNYTREVVGFDTFQGFPEISGEDVTGGAPSLHLKSGGFAYTDIASLEQCIAAYDTNRSLGHMPKIKLVRGDVCQTIPDYVAINQHLVVSLLHLDMDVYKPTRVALETIVPRMPKGAVIIFDQLNQAPYPGETRAVQETLGLAKLSLRRIGWETGLSYAVIE